jgi:hydroxypyruvate isomerase
VPRFAANLTMLFTEADFLDRFALAARAGFHAVEYLFPYPYEKQQLVDCLREHRLTQVLHNLPGGDWAAGERGIACLPGRQQEFQDGVAKAIEYATALGCAQVNCLSGIAPEGVSPDTLRATLIENLRFAARHLATAGVKLLLEPINNVRDIPGFLVNTTGQALDIIRDAGVPNLYLQADIYHMHVMSEDIPAVLDREIDRIAHVQIADDPGRHEPGTGTIDFTSVFAQLQRLRYPGWIGCEYRPSTTTGDSLEWLARTRHAS